MSHGKEAEQDAVTEEGFLQSLPNSDLCSFKGFLRIHPHQISFLSHLSPCLSSLLWFGKNLPQDIWFFICILNFRFAICHIKTLIEDFPVVQ